MIYQRIEMERLFIHSVEGVGEDDDIYIRRGNQEAEDGVGDEKVELEDEEAQRQIRMSVKELLVEFNCAMKKVARHGI